jgi:molecular chaperone DnaK (HSP70)
VSSRLAIDFGTSNTRVAVWDTSQGEAVSLSIPEISVTPEHTTPRGATGNTSFIPSLISYQGSRSWIGKQVLDRGLLAASGTFRWMKRFIASRLDLPRKIDGRSIRYSEAGKDYLVRILICSTEAIELGEEEIAFSVPVEAFEHYQEWLSLVCESAGIKWFRFIDEASAAALGYGLRMGSNDVCMVFDFGGGTLDVSIVRMDMECDGPGKCCVLGKAGAEIGGTTVDQWIFRDLLEKNGKTSEEVSHFSGLILSNIQNAKESLTDAEDVDFMAEDPCNGSILKGHYTRSAFENLLDENGMFEMMNRVVDRALVDSAERGYDSDSITNVLLVGGSSLIPCVRRTLRHRFGDRVRFDRPLDAVALGAAAFIGGVDLLDHIQHDYALRYYNPEKGVHDFLTIVHSGTPYPSKEPVRQITMLASYDEQEYLGLDIYEVSSRAGTKQTGRGAKFDLVFDPTGGAHFRERETSDAFEHFWVNEKSPSFVRASPPAVRGEKRFPVSFTIDSNKRLCVSVRDLKTGARLLIEHPLIKLR